MKEESIVVSPLQGQAVVLYKPEVTDAKQIKEVIEDMGYHINEFPEQDISAVEDEMQLRIEGLQFAEDGILIQSSLKALEVLSRSCIKP
ncbi:hypothetical protein J5N97_013641 [Dioscorea zingiberensis]|uniref:HMA domain-containing protein n=1 Tax=Dioscorea zingiberensis TaxID=325984 RepID=A0A9D5HJA0_9LILI|nr:hypothetical protein J5N97_013641 [Dioscorea zingiberensis]